MELLLKVFVTILGCSQVFCAPMTNSEALGHLVSEFFVWRIDAWPEYGTKVGINNHNARIDDYSESAFEHQKGNASLFLDMALAINESALNDQQERFTLQILKQQLETFIDGYKFRVHSIYNSFAWIDHPIYEWKRMLDYMPRDTAAHYEDMISRFRAMPTQIRQRISLMRIALEQHIAMHEYDLLSGREAINAELSTPVEQSVFYKYFADDKMADIEDKERLQSTCQGVIQGSVRPALRQLLDFLTYEYSGYQRVHPGVWSLPNGDNFYTSCLRWHLGPEVTADEMHQLGLQQVSMIQSKIDKKLVELGFNSTFGEYLNYLKEQPDQFFNSTEDALQGFRDIIDQVHTKLHQQLKHVTDIPVIVEPFTGARYAPPARPGLPGRFMVNLENRAKFSMLTLTLHEAEPGHHTQGTYITEGNVPTFRSNIEFLRYNTVPFNWPFQTANSEGWALYAEFIGEEIGLFDDDNYSLIGRYQSEMLRAVRLVVDTGIHAKRWSYEQAVEYMLNYTGSSNISVHNEIRRYIGWPGQACSYKYGELKIRELRSQAEAALGDDFDVREFHHQVLSVGNAPISVLQDHVTSWILSQQSQISSIAAFLDGHRLTYGTVSFLASVVWLVML